MRQLVKGSSILTMVSIGEMMMRFVRTKFIAVILGPAGTGFLAQLTILFETMRVWGDLGSRRAVIKQIAEQRKSGRKSPRYQEVIKTSYTLALGASFITASLVTLLAPLLSRQLYGTQDHAFFIIVTAWMLPIASLSTVTASIVKGNLDYLPFAKYTLGSYLLVILLSPAAIYFFRYWGAIAVQFLFFACPLAGYLLFNAKRRFLFFGERIRLSTLREQFQFGFFDIYYGSLQQLSRLVIAMWIVKQLGLEQMGLYQAVIAFSTIYMTIPIQAISGYIFPVIAAAESNDEIGKSINDGYRFLMFLLVPVIVLLMCLPEVAIRILYSAEFVTASNVLRIQLIHTLFLLAAYAFAGGLAAKGKLKSMFAAYTVHPLSFLFFSWLFFPKWGLYGVAGAAALAGFLDFCIQFSFACYYFKWKMHPKNMRLSAATVVWACVAIAEGFFSHVLWTRACVLLLGIPWFLISSKDHERKFLFEKIKMLFCKAEQKACPTQA